MRSKKFYDDIAMSGSVFIIDTFTTVPYRGNPTAVCFANDEANSNELLLIAAELNLPVTAFIIKTAIKEEFKIRYFTSTTEIPACGHATLAAARILFEQHSEKTLYFTTIHNIKIKAVWENGTVWLSYPVYTIKQYEPEKELMKSLGLSRFLSAGICVELETLFIELEDAGTLKAVCPNYALLVKTNTEIKEVVITSISDDSRYDFMLRSFCPWIGIDEDPVTGSVHSVLAGFWKARLGKEIFTAYQASSRGGEIFVKWFNDRVELGGKSVIILSGEWNSK